MDVRTPKEKRSSGCVILKSAGSVWRCRADYSEGVVSVGAPVAFVVLPLIRLLPKEIIVAPPWQMMPVWLLKMVELLRRTVPKAPKDCTPLEAALFLLLEATQFSRLMVATVAEPTAM